MSLDVDLDSPVPIYHQIADAIRQKILRGELQAGARLAPLREAAATLGVNLHTVRHAYAELARQGLVESRRALGTRILGPGATDRTSTGEGLPSFLGRIIAEAETRFGLTPVKLAEAIRELGGGAAARLPRVSVIECSNSQCRDLARQLEVRWAVEARPWSLEQKGAPPGGTWVATHFHYNEIRRRWPARLPEVHFVSIRPDPALAGALLAKTDMRPARATLCEFDEPTLAAISADLSVTLPAARFLVATRLIEASAQASDLPGSEPLILPPRVWGRLDPAMQRLSRLVPLRYLFDPDELANLGEKLNWRVQSGPRESPDG